MNTPKPATPLQFAQVIKMGSGYAVVEVNDLKDIRLLHVIGPLGKPTCPKCGQGLESEGGSVVRRGSMEWGPFYWECEDDGEQWGHA